MRKVAIACQGGGSQTAFTAGALRSLFDNGVHRRRNIVSLSGTSGGAICATLAWYGLLKEAKGDTTPIAERIKAFWDELSVQTPVEKAFDDSVAAMLRITDRGMIPHFESSPAGPITQMMMGMIPSFLPRLEFTDLKRLLEKHVRFDELKDLIGPQSPVLMIGAANVLTGELKKFNSLKGEICVEAILASAAVPNLFPAVKVGNDYYWDGLFSDNPPVQELIRARSVGGERTPDEVWIIQINPTTCKTVPTSPGEIIDRRNQMIGNVSLMQNLELIELINIQLRAGLLDAQKLATINVLKSDPIDVRFIRISEEVQCTLDYVSKLTRGPEHIHRLMTDGEKQGQAFVEEYVAEVKPGDGKVQRLETAEVMS
jgi:NTE family protein